MEEITSVYNHQAFDSPRINLEEIFPMKGPEYNTPKQKGHIDNQNSNDVFVSTPFPGSAFVNTQQWDAAIKGMTLLGQIVQRHRVAQGLSIECIAYGLEVEVDWAKRLEAGVMERVEINEVLLHQLSQLLHVPYLPLKLLADVKLTEAELAEQFNFTQETKEINSEHTS